MEWNWGYRENDSLGGSDPYSASKACAEHVIHTYYKSYFLRHECPVRIVSARAGNVIGGGDWSANRIVPDCMKAWAANRAVSIRRPQSTRPWQHVLEPLSGYLRLGQLLTVDPKLNGAAFNFGPPANQDHSVLALLERLRHFWFKETPEFDPVDLQPDSSLPEAGLLKLSCDKALVSLKWQSTMDFDETTEFTSAWYSAFYRSKKDMLELTLDQVRQYIDKARIKQQAWTI